MTCLNNEDNYIIVGFPQKTSPDYNLMIENIKTDLISTQTTEGGSQVVTSPLRAYSDDPFASLYWHYYFIYKNINYAQAFQIRCNKIPDIYCVIGKWRECLFEHKGYWINTYEQLQNLSLIQLQNIGKSFNVDIHSHEDIKNICICSNQNLFNFGCRCSTNICGHKYMEKICFYPPNHTGLHAENKNFRWSDDKSLVDATILIPIN